MTMNRTTTMTSVELTEVINSIRKEEGGNEITHSNLMVRIKGFANILPAMSIQLAEYLDKQDKISLVRCLP